MGVIIEFKEDDSGQFAGEGKAPRGIYQGHATITEGVTAKSKLAVLHVTIKPGKCWVPGPDGKGLVEGTPRELVTTLFLPSGDDPEQQDRNRRQILGYCEAITGKQLAGKKFDVTKVKGEVTVRWDPSFVEKVYDAHAPLTAEQIEKLETPEEWALPWPMDTRVQRGPKADDKGKGGKAATGRDAFKPKGKGKDEDEANKGKGGDGDDDDLAFLD